VAHDTSYAEAVEGIIHAVVSPQVEPEHERDLVRQMTEAGIEPERETGFFHLYLAPPHGIAYLGCAPNPYDGIAYDQFASAVRSGCPLVLVSHGWAAPADEHENDVAPSEHPEKRRVRLTIVIEGLDRMTSVIRFPGEDETLVEQDCRGDLRDAIESRILDIVHSMS